LRGGGQERALSSLANYYAATGHKVSVINLFRTEQFFHLDERIKVTWPEIKRSKHNRFIYAFLIIPYLRKAVRQANPDFILSYGEWFNPFVILSTFALKIPLFVLDRMGPGMDLGILIGTARKILYKFATGVIVQTSTAAAIVREKTKARNISIIPNPVNVIDTNVSVKKKQIVSVGRLTKEKGHIILVRAFAMLEERNWTLHIVGDGPERLNLIEEASSLGVVDRIFFHGLLKDFGTILGESEIFVLPSYYEGFPNSLIEAMSVPLACISSDCTAGPRDIIEHGINGILVEAGNVESLAKWIEDLISNPVLRDKLATEAFRIREKLAFNKIAAQYLDFISNHVG
jgi:glycosyltransferase involved in cell wall biosynthesis